MEATLWSDGCKFSSQSLSRGIFKPSELITEHRVVGKRPPEAIERKARKAHRGVVRHARTTLFTWAAPRELLAEVLAWHTRALLLCNLFAGVHYP